MDVLDQMLLENAESIMAVAKNRTTLNCNAICTIYRLPVDRTMLKYTKMVIVDPN